MNAVIKRFICNAPFPLFSSERGAPGELPPSSSEEDSEEEESSDEDEPDKPKGVGHLIAIENPNRAKQTTKKVTSIDGQVDKTQLSRREREEIEKQVGQENE